MPGSHARPVKVLPHHSERTQFRDFEFAAAALAVHAPTSAAPATVGGVWTGVKQLLWDPRQAAFFARVLLFGFATGCVNYLMLYLKELGE